MYAKELSTVAISYFATSQHSQD